VLVVDSARPISGKGVFQRFRLTGAFEGSTHDFFNEAVNSTKDLFIGFLPIKIIFPGAV